MCQCATTDASKCQCLLLAGCCRVSVANQNDLPGCPSLTDSEVKRKVDMMMVRNVIGGITTTTIKTATIFQSFPRMPLVASELRMCARVVCVVERYRGNVCCLSSSVTACLSVHNKARAMSVCLCLCVNIGEQYIDDDSSSQLELFQQLSPSVFVTSSFLSSACSKAIAGYTRPKDQRITGSLLGWTYTER